MDLELTHHLRLRIQFGRNPACLDSAGNTEHWKVEVWERFTCHGVIRTSYEITTELEYIHVPDKWDDWTLVPAHRIEIPGCTVEPVSLDNFTKALKRARERALVLSGYMLDEEFPREETAFDGPKYSSPKKPKVRKPKKPTPSIESSSGHSGEVGEYYYGPTDM